VRAGKSHNPAMQPPTTLVERVLPSKQRWPLHGVVGTRAIELNALATVPEFTLMARAGASLARLAIAIAPRGHSAWVACGPGNNGGDGLVAAAELARRGWRVRTTMLPGDRAPSSDAAHALDLAREAGVSVELGSLATPAAGEVDLVIDALLGIGTSRPPDGAMAAVIDAINGTRGAPVLAADVPSGLAVDTGCVIGGAAVRASHTLSMLTLKPGLFTHHGRDHAGTVWLARLGVAEGAPPDAWLSAPPEAAPRQHSQHKGSFGDVRVIGGSTGMAGAAVLAARAALAAGAGRVYMSLLTSATMPVDAIRPELMLRPFDASAAPAHFASATVVCGCGGGDAVAAVLPVAIHHASRLVLDADALNATAASPALQRALRARAARGLPSVLTPHPLEAARLLGSTAAHIQADRLGAARFLARDLCSTVVLKGSGTVIAGAHPDQALWLNPTGNARLGTAGTGDVLAGWIGGSWAARATGDGLKAAADAAWLHGHAAEQAQGSHAMRAAELIEHMVALR